MMSYCHNDELNLNHKKYLHEKLKLRILIETLPNKALIDLLNYQSPTNYLYKQLKTY